MNLRPPAPPQGTARSRGGATSFGELVLQLDRLAIQARTLLRTTGLQAITVGRRAAGQELGAVSTAPIGLDPSATSTTLGSTEEVNATPTSFSPFAPAVGPQTTAQPLVDGVYNGIYGDDTLTFKIKKDKIVGSGGFRVEILDGLGTQVDEIKFKEDYVPGTPLTLASGLTLSFSAGFVKKNETFTVDVSQTVGSAVDPDKPITGSGASDPNLQYGLDIAPGTFYVNGVPIDVVGTDTLTTILGRITASSAGVTATFDAASESVLFERQDSGSLDITLGSDGTGFFAATKLSGATQVLGEDPDQERPLAELAAFAGVTAGDFFVGSTSVAVDPATDSLTDVLDRINASGAGVVASYDVATDRVRITSKTGGSEFTVDDGTSAFFSAVGIAEDTYGGTLAVGETTTTFDGGPQLRAGLMELGRTLASLLDTTFSAADVGLGAVAHGRLRSAVAGAFEGLVEDPDADRLSSGFGIGFDLRRPDSGVLELDVEELLRAIERSPEELADFLFAAPDGEGNGGLLTGLAVAVEEIWDYLRTTPEGQEPGSLIDVLG